MYLGIKTQTVYFNFTHGKILLNMRLKLESALLVSAPRPPQILKNKIPKI